jgi:two-component system, response regulator YesN
VTKERLLDVLIVDDELPLREELRLFDWAAHGFRLAGEAENGEMALRFCRERAPDVVITDITMPIMDGITLFRRLREEGIALQVILLTCHSEFDYAREAIQLGAVEYLIKVEMDDPDIVRALSKAREAHERHRLLSTKVAEGKRWELSKALSKVLAQAGASGKDGQNTELLEMLKRLYGLKPPLRSSALHVELKRELRLPGLREVEEYLIELEHNGLPFRWAAAGEGIYLLVSGAEARVAEEDVPAEAGREAEGLIQLAERLEDELSYLNGALRIYAVTAPGLAETEEEAVEQFRLLSEKPLDAFYEPERRVYAGGGDKGKGPGESLAALDKLVATLPDTERLLVFIREELGKWAFANRLHPAALQSWASLQLRQRRGAGGAEGIWDDAARTCAEAGSIDELTAVLLHMLKPAGTGKGVQRKLRKEIADAQRYIREHLDQSLTLVSVANQVGLSSHYLSRLFRIETGSSFNDYVTQQRMEKAIGLLQNTTMRVYEVGNAVGIPSYRYFTATFRQYTGQSPTFYKKG